MADMNVSKGFDADFDRKSSIIYGVILGIVSFFLGIIVLLVVKSAQSFWVIMSMSFLINLGVFILITVFLSFQLRKKIGGYWSFSVALKSIFTMLAISTIISTLGTQIYVNKVNPQLQIDVLQNTLNATIQYMEDNKVPDKIIDEKVANIEKEIESIGSITIGQVLKGLAITLLMEFVFSLMLAALTKRERYATSINTELEA